MGTSTHERPVGASHGGGPTSILDWTGPVWAEVALVEDRVTAAALTGAVGERTKASVVDLTDKQLDDRGRVVVQGGDGEVEVGREPPGGSGVDLPERGAPLKATSVRTPHSDKWRSSRSWAMSMTAASRPCGDWAGSWRSTWPWVNLTS